MQAQAVGDHERRVETLFTEWLQPLTEGLTGESSSPTDVSPADLHMPLPALLLSSHPLAKPVSNKEKGTHTQVMHSFSETPELEALQTHESDESAMQKKS